MKPYTCITDFKWQTGKQSIFQEFDLGDFGIKETRCRCGYDYIVQRKTDDNGDVMTSIICRRCDHIRMSCKTENEALLIESAKMLFNNKTSRRKS